VILGGSSGFGLAAAQKLAQHGMNLCLVHRAGPEALPRIEPEFEKIRGAGVKLLAFDADAREPGRRAEVVGELAGALGGEGRVRMLLHAIAPRGLRPLAPVPSPGCDAARGLAERLGVDEARVRAAADDLLAAGLFAAHGLASPPLSSEEGLLDERELARAVHGAGASLLGWVREIFERGIFDADARVFGLTGEDGRVARRGRAAAAAAKVALESLARSIAVEFAPFGIRCNVVQAGVIEGPASAGAPGGDPAAARARMRNPLGRLTTPADVAGAVYLLCRDEAAWINGAVIRVDGGEHISGSTR
jgi:NAD(P)-dependent dehydrogenase (short-subunit alcohol dehydrogenase family)